MFKEHFTLSYYVSDPLEKMMCKYIHIYILHRLQFSDKITFKEVSISELRSSMFTRMA